MKAVVGIALAAIAFTSVRAGNPLKSVRSESDSESASASADSWDFSWDASGSAAGCDQICPTDFEPVCGSDGVTYTNECAFGIAHCRTPELNMTATGKCAGGSFASSIKGSKAGSAATACPDACIDVYDPVSDESGKTYSNECYMRMAKCKNTKNDSGNDDSDSSSTASKVSQSTKPPSKAEKTTKEEKTSKTTKSTKSTKISSTSDSGIGSLYEDGSNGVVGSASSASSADCADACPDIYSPVCGSDGVTYSSSCQLELASCNNPKLKLVEASEDVCAGSEGSTSKQQTVSEKASKSTKTSAA